MTTVEQFWITYDAANRLAQTRRYTLNGDRHVEDYLKDREALPGWKSFAFYASKVNAWLAIMRGSQRSSIPSGYLSEIYEPNGIRLVLAFDASKALADLRADPALCLRVLGISAT